MLFLLFFVILCFGLFVGVGLLFYFLLVFFWIVVLGNELVFFGVRVGVGIGVVIEK